MLVAQYLVVYQANMLYQLSGNFSNCQIYHFCTIESPRPISKFVLHWKLYYSRSVCPSKWENVFLQSSVHTVEGDEHISGNQFSGQRLNNDLTLTKINIFDFSAGNTLIKS